MNDDERSAADEHLVDGHPIDERTALARRVFPDGEEPDPRFTLANERTFLAWTRTSLAFLAGGIALEAVPLHGVPDWMRTLLGVFVIVVGLAISAGAAVHWIHVERAMRHSRALPLPAIIPLLSAAAVLACVIALVIVLL
ncbi:DUF202 domain-containing protein [Brevibacterium sp. 91QC2O2]|uniref:YidH family protein n=1 Tax=Brevibacterium sp. 91QC2O2 TaxID=2968458 RepID=UPI00211B7994|nr:DUF202 domain-containing protein [Brevibacterium sp. 91QC2O2]MCQ9369270.1 DUF202 domain-containing protein [Brevibacterium sp. 91QC2O2]